MSDNKTTHQIKDEILAKLYSASDTDTAVNGALELVGNHFNVSRVYIFENSEDDPGISNTFEWCNEGILPEKENLQHIRYLEDTGENWYDNYNENGLFVCQDVRMLPVKQREILEPQGICGMLRCAIQENGIYKGFIGFDNCNHQPRNWALDAETVEALVFISRLLAMFLLKQRSENRLNQALSKVREANNAKNEFFSRMSHDMRTPMNGILGLADLSEGEEDAAVLKENIAKIKTSGEYLLGLINDTLAFQKIESGKMKILPQVVECSSCIRDMLEMVKVLAEEKHIDFREEVNYQEIQGYVRVDPIRMKQIFLNLLSNAIKFTPEYGTVCFQLDCNKTDEKTWHAVARVKDTGIGMSEDFLRHKLFQPFTQEYNQLSAQYAGSGLGLSIVKRLTDMMGGTIHVDSKLGEGTVFTLSMDVEKVPGKMVQTQEADKARQKNTAYDMLHGKRILLVEDHALNAEIAKRLLQKAGCEVIWAENGQIAIEKFQESEIAYYDAVLMDIRMPVMDGLMAARSIRNLPRRDADTIPILAMTANAYDEDMRKSKAAGMNDHLLKPIEPQRLYEALETYIGKISRQSSATKRETIRLETLKNMVSHVWKEDGAFSVAYGSFNSIYQFMERNLSRTNQNVQILLFTARNQWGNVPAEVELKPIMETLNQSVRFSLREGDLMMEFNTNQIAILLVNCDNKNGGMVAERILESYRKKSSESKIRIHYEISNIQGKDDNSRTRKTHREPAPLF